MERKIVKTCDLSAEVAARLFVMLNSEDVYLVKAGSRIEIYTEKSPLDLRYPEGWYYGKGCFRNKHESTTGSYSEVTMRLPSGAYWEDIVSTCNR